MAHKRDTKEGELISVASIIQDFWARHGRNFYCRYDYEGSPFLILYFFRQFFSETNYYK